MLSRANRRIVALLGFSSVVHAGALLAYGYFYSAPQQAVYAAPTLQLRLQSGLPQPTGSSAPAEQVADVTETLSRILVTHSQQAEFSVQSRPVVEVPVIPLLVHPLIKQPDTPSLAVVPASKRIQVPEPVQKVVPRKRERDIASEDMIKKLLLTSSNKAVEAVAEIAKHTPDKILVAALTPENSGTDSITAEDSSRSDSSSALSASELPGSAELASIKSQLGEQLQHALESYFSYPLKARRKGWQGEVLLTVGIGRNGEVDSVQLASSSGYAVLDRAALKSMQQVSEIDLASLEIALADQSLQIEIPVAYRLVN